MPKRIEIDDEVLAKIESQCPKYLSPTGFINLLLDQGLTASATLMERRGDDPRGEDPLSGISKAVTSSLKEQNKTKTNKVRKPKIKTTKGTPEFEEFWGIYQACNHKANGQSKAKAWEMWPEVIKQESPDRIVEAARKAVQEIERRMVVGEFASPLPDCFRWLRDGQWASLLESHTPTQTSSWTML